MKKIKSVFAVVAVLFSLGVGFLLPKKDACAVTSRPLTVRGSSLTGIIEDGTRVVLQEGYYECHAVERNELVVYRYGGSYNPIIKMVRGVPSDQFLIEPFQDKGYQIRLNGVILMTSKSEPYLFSKERADLLKLYERDYKGTIPADSYLLLGNLPGGSVDSLRFGLVSKEDIIGKVELP